MSGEAPLHVHSQGKSCRLHWAHSTSFLLLWGWAKRARGAPACSSWAWKPTSPAAAPPARLHLAIWLLSARHDLPTTSANQPGRPPRALCATEFSQQIHPASNHPSLTTIHHVHAPQLYPFFTRACSTPIFAGRASRHLGEVGSNQPSELLFV